MYKIYIQSSHPHYRVVIELLFVPFFLCRLLIDWAVRKSLLAPAKHTGGGFGTTKGFKGRRREKRAKAQRKVNQRIGIQEQFCFNIPTNLLCSIGCRYYYMFLVAAKQADRENYEEPETKKNNCPQASKVFSRQDLFFFTRTKWACKHRLPFPWPFIVFLTSLLTICFHPIFFYFFSFIYPFVCAGEKKKLSRCPESRFGLEKNKVEKIEGLKKVSKSGVDKAKKKKSIEIWMIEQMWRRSIEKERREKEWNLRFMTIERDAFQSLCRSNSSAFIFILLRSTKFGQRSPRAEGRSKLIA